MRTPDESYPYYLDDLAGLNAIQRYYRMTDAARLAGDKIGTRETTENIVRALNRYNAEQRAVTSAERIVRQEARELAMRRANSGDVFNFPTWSAPSAS